MNYIELYTAWKSADKAFNAALKAQFGAGIHIGDYRYGQKPFNPATLAARDSMREAKRVYDAAVSAGREVTA